MRIAVVTPFMDRQHGSERATAQLVECLVHKYGEEVHLFAQRLSGIEVQDAAAVNRSTAAGQILWHRVPSVRGPYLRQFRHWLRHNQRMRSDSQFDLIFSPGVNCMDANVVLVHAFFARLRDLAQREGSEDGAGLLRNLHRRLYYGTVARSESRLYRDPQVRLAAVSRRTARMLGETYGRGDILVIPNGVDTAEFSVTQRLQRRAEARSRRKFTETDFVLLLIGNDWRNKGLSTLLQAVAKLADLPCRVLIAGEDAPRPFQDLASGLGVAQRCVWEGPRSDVIDLYSAADVYVGPSLEDSFGLPVLEAMACGLPAITSAEAGVSELVTNERDAFVLPEAGDAGHLASLLRRLHSDATLCGTVAQAAARTAAQWTWDRHTSAVWQLLRESADANAPA